MKVLTYFSARQSGISEVATPSIRPDQVLTKTIVSNVSAGTEMGFYRGTAPQFQNAPDADGTWHEKENAISYPMSSSDPGCWWMGYACVSKVVEVGTARTDLKVGDIIFTPSSHKEYNTVDTSFIKVPDSLSPEEASFATLVKIAFTGLLDTDVKLLDNVVIIGMGTLGQLLVQMCKKSGASVIAADYLDERLARAAGFGADLTVTPGKGEDLATRTVEFFGRKADKIIEVSGNSNALSQAVKCVCKDGQVTVLSFYAQPADNFQMGMEFHHNRVIIRSSQAGGINPALANQYDNKARDEATMKLLGQLDVKSLISNRCPFGQYPELLKELDENPQSFQSIVIEY